MNYYPFHIGDYLSATRHLSWEEDAAYRRLLDTYYTNEKPLPSELRAVCRLVLANTDTACSAWSAARAWCCQRTPTSARHRGFWQPSSVSKGILAGLPYWSPSAKP